MKQVYLFAVLSMLLGWIVGDMTRPLEARKIPEHATRSGGLLTARPIKQLAPGTIEVAATLQDGLTGKDLPSEVIDARTKAQKARMRALKKALDQIYSKNGIAQGGPLLPMTAFGGKPRPRPGTPRDVPVVINTAFYQPGTPFPVFPGPGNSPWFAPGDPRTPQHITWFDVFPNGAGPVPEPATWMMMILGFAALAWRVNSRKARLQA